MTFVLVPKPEGFEIGRGLLQNVIRTLTVKETYIAFGDVGKHILLDSFFDSTSTYNIFSLLWCIPSSV